MTNLVYSAFHYLQKCIKERILCKDYAETANNSAQMSKQYANDKINQTYLSNNIIEIPQDIKLELADGVLTLKAGSKVYVPNGIGKFDVVTVAKDISNNTTGAGEKMFLSVYNNGANLFSGYTTGETVTERPVSPINYALYYNTTTNKVEFYNGSTWISNCSFPISLYTRGSLGATSIDQVFNGFGYIGSSKFRLPGIEFLTPNGRNDDGTLRSDKKVTQNVSVSTYGYQPVNQQWFITETGNTRSSAYIIQDNEPTPIRYSFWYSPLKNLLYFCTDTTIGWEERHDYVLAAKNIYTDSTYKITSIDFVKPFRVANGNDVATIDNFRVVSTLPSTPFDDVFYFIPE
jgi:hypothetical protein